jgi:branched-chain amino acid transport system permease protein
MDLATNFQLLVSGLAMGSIYALVALGFVLINNAAGVVNFAQGEFVMVPAFFAVMLLARVHLPFFPAYVLTLVGIGAFGLVFERVCYYPLRNRTFLPVIISTIGASLFMKNGAQLVFGTEPLNPPKPVPSAPIMVGQVAIDPQYILILGVTIIMLILQYLFFEKTNLGRKLQATAQDKEMSRLLGIRISVMIAITFVYSSILGGVAGILVGPVFYVTKDMGGLLGLKAFCSAIVGGFGSVPGAILGGFLLGIIEQYSAYYISSAYRDGFAFIILIAVLLFRPMGFFGEKVSEKA